VNANRGHELTLSYRWYAYHEQLGEVHCGTNARRRPPADIHWWEYRPEGAFDT